MKYYKLLNNEDAGSYTNFKWDLSGKWMSVEGKIEVRRNGFHVLRKKDIVFWLGCGFNLYEVEIKGDKINSVAKVCVRSVRVIKKIENYNKDNLLKTVIKPAVERAKQYAATCCVFAEYAEVVAYNAAAACAAATNAANTASADDAAYFAANAANAANANAGAEKAKQTKDLEKLLK